jgi:hypothetical protein
MFCEFRFRTGLWLERFDGAAEKALLASLFFAKIKKDSGDGGTPDHSFWSYCQ